ncbi:MAG: metallophosphoesterase [Clostridia bacterium]|nr:metallophosphoesterase [Clostridia bacterium]
MFDVKTDTRFRVESARVPVAALTKTYRVCQLSDAHMSPDSPLDDSETREKAAKHRDIWMGHGNGLTQEENWAALSAFAKENGASRLLLAGDMVDFPAVGATAEVKALFDAWGEVLYVPGNHEATKAHDPYLEPLTNGSPALQIVEWDELTLLGVNNARHTVTDEQLAAVTDVLYGDKPVVLLQHTPMSCETLRPDAIAYWQDVSYFLFGEAGMDDNAKAYHRLLTEETTQLCAVVAGHLHFAHADHFPNGVPQLISAPCLAGYARMIEFVPSEI